MYLSHAKNPTNGKKKKDGNVKHHPPQKQTMKDLWSESTRRQDRRSMAKERRGRGKRLEVGRIPERWGVMVDACPKAGFRTTPGAVRTETARWERPRALLHSCSSAHTKSHPWLGANLRLRPGHARALPAPKAPAPSNTRPCRQSDESFARHLLLHAAGTFPEVTEGATKSWKLSSPQPPPGPTASTLTNAPQLRTYRVSCCFCLWSAFPGDTYLDRSWKNSAFHTACSLLEVLGINNFGLGFLHKDLTTVHICLGRCTLPFSFACTWKKKNCSTCENLNFKLKLQTGFPPLFFSIKPM